MITSLIKLFGLPILLALMCANSGHAQEAQPTFAEIFKNRRTQYTADVVIHSKALVRTVWDQLENEDSLTLNELGFVYDILKAYFDDQSSVLERLNLRMQKTLEIQEQLKRDLATRIVNVKKQIEETQERIDMLNLKLLPLRSGPIP